ncbi:MAG TPA: methyl-accepting chemotaxis protein [Oligoflexia bacterium]|nr:methyl-accepting chemotaxis protein [Oligoflexia bacterium]
MFLKNRRAIKNFLIFSDFQARYIFWMVLSGILLVGINTGIFYSFMSENYAILVDLSPMTQEAKDLMYAELNKIVWLLLGSSVGVLALLAILALVFSHRAAGPMFNFMKTFEAIKKGDRNVRVRLRPNDHFQEVAREFNEMMDSITSPKS